MCIYGQLSISVATRMTIAGKVRMFFYVKHVSTTFSSSASAIVLQLSETFPVFLCGIKSLKVRRITVY